MAFYLWLGSLPVVWQIILPILFMIVIVIIAIYGHMWINIGKNKVGFGKQTSSTKRSCIDCSKFHRAEAAKVNRRIMYIESNTMKHKMNYVSQKLKDLKHIIYTEYSNTLKDNNGGVHDDEMLRNLNAIVKLVVSNSINDEIRRSLKENGFHEREGKRFSEYVDDQCKTIIGIMEEDFLYYYRNDMIIELTSKIREDVKNILCAIYDNAKQVEIESEDKINSLETIYDQSIDKFIGVKNESI